jgi:hypothetical protein
MLSKSGCALFVLAAALACAPPAGASFSLAARANQAEKRLQEAIQQIAGTGARNRQRTHN